MSARMIKRFALSTLLAVLLSPATLAFATCSFSPAGFYGYAGEDFFDELENYLDDLFDDDD